MFDVKTGRPFPHALDRHYDVTGTLLNVAIELDQKSAAKLESSLRLGDT